MAIKTNDGSYEVLYYDAMTGEHNTHGASDLKEERWNTWTCVWGWAVKAIWSQKGYDGTDVNYVSRSKAPLVDDY